jgi:hypothetical protein
MPTSTNAQVATTEWLDTALHPAYADTALQRIAEAVENAIDPFVRDLGVTVPLAPGNGWTYDMRLQWLRADDETRWGGNLLVSIPAQRVCMVVHLPAMLFPSYVAEKMEGFGPADAAIVAAFLTRFSAAVADYLD